MILFIKSIGKIDDDLIDELLNIALRNVENMDETELNMCTKSIVTFSPLKIVLYILSMSDYSPETFFGPNSKYRGVRSVGKHNDSYFKP